MKKKTALLKSAISLLLCFSMLLGSTYAWFTDNVTSTGNIITTGTLDVEMYWTDDLNSGVWYNVEEAGYNTIFSYDNWEPGYTDVKYIKLVNAGSLAMNYKLTIAPQNEVGKLAEVINVYFANEAVQVQSREDLSKLGAIGLLSSVLNGGATANGTLLAADQLSDVHPSGEVIMTIAMSMITTAGNDYQGEDAGDFTIKALATQAPYEQDTFGSDYDGAATLAVLGLDRATVAVTPVDGKVPTGGATMTGSNISAYAPEGVAMADGADKLTLTVTPLDESDTGFSTVNDEILIPVDVHVDGVAANNAVPVIVNLGQILPKYLNMGNYRLYHVENGVNTAMTLVNSVDALTSHNTFTYDPMTGEVTVAMATFSEVALIAETNSAWEGAIAEAFSGGTGTEADPYLIANADQLAFFNECISNYNETYGDKYYRLLSNLNLGGETQTFYPIGYHKVGGNIATIDLDDAPTAIYEINEDTKLPGSNIAESANVWYTFGGAFEGVFDGAGHTIGNFYQNTWVLKGNYDGHYWNAAMGLFGYVYGGTIKNLTVDNFSSDGEFTPTGVIAAYAAGDATFENISITNCNPRVYNTGNGGIIGIAGNTSAANDDHITLKNITVDNSNKISALWGSWDVACGGLVGMYRGNVDGNGNATGDTISFENCHVAAQIDVNNDVCANYQYYAYRYSGMIIGSVRHNVVKDGKTVPNMAGISASGCTVNYGNWNDYYYCEFEKNTMASYSEDYQFSRVDKSEIIFDENGKAIGCIHNHTDAEDKRAVYLPFYQLFTGYSWGVSSIGLKEYSGIVTGLGITEGDHNESVNKFATIAGVQTYRPGATYTLGELFAEVPGSKVNIVDSSVYVSVSPATEVDQVSGTYNANIADWTKGTITFADNCEGSAKIIITDYYFCNVTVLILNKEEATERFEAKEQLEVKAYTSVKLSDLFEATGKLTGDVLATFTDQAGNETTVTVPAEEWTTAEVTLIQPGEWTVFIKDSDAYCIATENTITVVETEAFESKFTGNFIYRVGNQNAVSLGTLFSVVADVNSADVNSADVTATVTNASGNSNASGIFTADTSDWTKGTIQFSGTGVVTVAISAPGAKTVELKLEVVDAVNATTATSATANNVVLLNNCGFGSLEVKNGYTLYGNGFTLTCGSDSAALDFSYSFVTLENGILDNVQIVTPNYDYAALYKSNLTSSDNRSQTTDKTRYYNAKSAVMVSGNSQILNSRISGARAAVNVAGGNLLIDNSRIEGGAVASILVGSANSVILRDATLIQKPTASTYDPSKTLMGFSVLFVCDANGDAAPVTIEGTLVQNAWVDEDDKKYVPSEGQSIISTVLGKTDYLHDLDGDGTKESLNLGFAYMPESLTSKVNTTTITDNRTNKNDAPYDYAEVSILNGKTYVYSYKNTNGTDESFNNNNNEYTPNTQGDIITVTYADTKDGLELGKSFGTSGWVYELNVDLDKLSGYALDFSKLSMRVNGVIVTDFKVNGAAKPGTVPVVAGGTTYTLTATVNGKDYPATFKVIGTETSKESPSKISGPTTAGFGVAKSYGSDWSGAADVLTGVKIKYWSVAENKYVEFDFSNFTVPGNAGKLNGTNSYWEYTHTNNDFTLKVTNTVAIHSGKSVYGMPIRGTDGKLYFTISSTNGYVGSGTTSRSVTMQYEFTDNNGGEKLTFTHTFNIGYSKDDQYSYSDLSGSGKLTKLQQSSGGSTECITADTLITLANGKQVRVDSLKGDELLLVWNMETGKYEAAPIVFVDNDAETEYEIVHLYFSDGSDVKVIYEHGFFDLDLGKYVYIDATNYADYVGHKFVKQGDVHNDAWKEITLEKVVIEREVTTAWSPVTFEHLCYYTNGVLSMPGGISGLFNIFEVDTKTMTYDAQQMQKDIETYGLLTLEDFGGMITKEAFDAFNGDWLMVSIGKGLLTWEDIAYMAERYIPLM